MRFYPQFRQPLGDLYDPFEENKTLTKICILLSMVLSCQLAGGRFEVMLFLLWEFFHRHLCLQVWFAEGILSLNSPFSSCPPLGSRLTRMSGKGTGTWDWLWFLDLLAEWLLLSSQASQSSHQHNDRVHLKWGLLCPASSAAVRPASTVPTTASCKYLKNYLNWACAGVPTICTAFTTQSVLKSTRYDLRHTGAYSYVCLYIYLYTSTCTWVVQGTWASSGESSNKWGLGTHSLLEPGRNVGKCLWNYQAKLHNCFLENRTYLRFIGSQNYQVILT